MSAPLYAIPCVAESTLSLRGLHRTPDTYLLEGPDADDQWRPPPRSHNPPTAFDSLRGLYECPPAAAAETWMEEGDDEVGVDGAGRRGKQPSEQLQITEGSTRSGHAMFPSTYALLRNLSWYSCNLTIALGGRCSNMGIDSSRVRAIDF